jgi:hypothetical protein
MEVNLGEGGFFVQINSVPQCISLQIGFIFTFFTDGQIYKYLFLTFLLNFETKS